MRSVDVARPMRPTCPRRPLLRPKREDEAGITSRRTRLASSSADVTASSKEQPSAQWQASLKRTMPVAAETEPESTTRTSATSETAAAASRAQRTSGEKDAQECTDTMLRWPLAAIPRYASTNSRVSSSAESGVPSVCATAPTSVACVRSM